MARYMVRPVEREVIEREFDRRFPKSEEALEEERKALRLLAYLMSSSTGSAYRDAGNHDAGDHDGRR